MERVAQAARSLTGSGVDRGRGVDRVESKSGLIVDRVGSNGSGFDRVGSRTGRVLTVHDDVIMTSAPGN